MKKFAVIVVIFTAGMLTAVSLVGFASEMNVPFELCSHLRYLLLILSFAVTLAALPTKNTIAMVICAAALMLNMIPIAILYLPAEKAVLVKDEAKLKIAQTHNLKVMQFNLWGGKNKEYVEVVKAVIDANPDIIGFSEITPTWLKLMKAGLRSYPYVIADTEYGGIAVFSRLPIAHSEFKHYGDWHRPRAVAQIQLGGGSFTLICVHSSIPNVRPELRNGEFKVLAEEAKAAAKLNSVVLIGDLNCTPWSSYFTRLLTDSSLKDTEQGFGLQPSWNAFLPVLLVPIDHCLVSKDVTTTGRRTCPRVGSDHLPVIVTLELQTREISQPQK